MKRKIAYSVGAVATALSYQAFSTYIFFFYIEVARLAAGFVAAGMAVFAVWNAINDPVAGFISDRTKTRWGRRIPYIALGAVPFGLIYYLLWIPPFDPSRMMMLFLYFVATICLFDLAYTVVVLNWASLFPEMFASLKERAEVNALRQAFGMFGLMLGVALPPLIYSTIGWGWMGAVFGSAISLIFLATLLGSRERPEFMEGKKLGLKDAFINCFSSRPFVTFVFSNVFVQYAFLMVLASIPFFGKYILAARPEQLSAVLFVAPAAAMISMFFWRRMAVRLGAKHAYMAAIVVMGLALVPFFFASEFNSVLMFSAFAGVGLAGIILLSDILISDVIDHDEIRTGERREGIYFGFNAFITRMAVALQAGSIGAVFTITGYDQADKAQPELFFSGLRFLMAGLPILALVTAFIVMLFYPLSARAAEETANSIKASREKRTLRAMLFLLAILVLSVPAFGARRVALTFDDGPNPGITCRVLDILEEHGAKATFFVIGEKVERHPILLRRISKAGHEIGNHTWGHHRMTWMNIEKIRDDLNRTSGLIEDLTGQPVLLFRPPHGRIDAKRRRAVERMGYRVVMWNVNGDDFYHAGRGVRSPGSIVNRVVSGAGNGSVVLLHDSTEEIVDALPKMLRQMKKRGYRFVTVSELSGRPARR